MKFVYFSFLILILLKNTKQGGTGDDDEVEQPIPVGSEGVTQCQKNLGLNPTVVAKTESNQTEDQFNKFKSDLKNLSIGQVLDNSRFPENTNGEMIITNEEKEKLKKFTVFYIDLSVQPEDNCEKLTTAVNKFTGDCDDDNKTLKKLKIGNGIYLVCFFTEPETETEGGVNNTGTKIPNDDQTDQLI